MTNTEIRNREIRDAVLNLASVLADQAHSPTFEALRERMVNEPDPAKREELSDQLLTVVSRWTFRAAEVVADLYAVAARQPCRIAEVPKDEPPDAA